jgi:hypothetical protein
MLRKTYYAHKLLNHQVSLYCRCLVPIHEEVLGPHDSESLRPLAIAAKFGQIEAMKILLG